MSVSSRIGGPSPPAPPPSGRGPRRPVPPRACRYGDLLAPARSALAARQRLRLPRCAVLRALQDPQHGAWGVRGNPFGWHFGGQATADQCRRVMHRRRQPVGQRVQQLYLGGAPVEPRRDVRLQRCAVRRRQAQRGCGTAERGKQDERPGTGGPLLLRRYVAPGERRPPVVVARCAGEERTGHPARAARADEVLAAPAQMPGPLEVVQRGPQCALPVREHLCEGLHGDVGAVRQPVDVGGDGGLARRQMREIACGAWVLAGRGPLAVTRIGHRVRRGVRGYVRCARGSTKLVGSHWIALFDLVGQAPVRCSSTGRGRSLFGTLERRDLAWQADHEK
jgi:hypothetical protein